MTFYKKCETAGCHRRLKGGEELRQQLENTRKEIGGHRAGVICPQCVADLLQDTDKAERDHYFDMSAGEILAESLVETPRWRIIIPALREKDPSKKPPGTGTDDASQDPAAPN